MRIEDNVRSALERRAESVHPHEHSWESLQRARARKSSGVRRGLTIGLAFLLSAASLGFLMNEFNGSGGPSPASSQAAPAIALPTGAFVPQTDETSDGRVLLRMTFPDGTLATVEYESSMQVATLGARPYWGGGECVAAYYRDGLPPELEAARPIRSWNEDGRTVTLVESKIEGFGQTFVLLFDASPWVLAVSETATGEEPSEQLLSCVPVVKAALTQDGWVIREDAASHNDWGPPSGPWIEFGSLAPERLQLIVWPGPCKPFGNTALDGVSIALQDDSATWCDPGGMMRFTAYFEPGSSLPEDVIRGLDVVNVQLAGTE